MNIYNLFINLYSISILKFISKENLDLTAQVNGECILRLFDY